jgi:Domain of unknown function (DUF4902)
LKSILHSYAPLVLKISRDGYIRIAFSDLTSLPFLHLCSEHDPDFCEELQAKAIPSRIAGFSECRSDTTPAISLGWGWYVHDAANCLMLAPEPVRSNVMLIDKYGYDLGNVATAGVLSAWFALFDWQGWLGHLIEEFETANLACQG